MQCIATVESRTTQCVLVDARQSSASLPQVLECLYNYTVTRTQRVSMCFISHDQCLKASEIDFEQNVQTEPQVDIINLPLPPGGGLPVPGSDGFDAAEHSADP